MTSHTSEVAGRLIRTARRQADLSQQAVADALGVRQQTVAKWESGENRPTVDNTLALAEAVPDLDPLAVTGVVSSSPLAIRELESEAGVTVWTTSTLSDAEAAASLVATLRARRGSRA